MKIMLNDLLQINEADLGNVKIRCTQSNGIEDPMDLYKSNPEKINVDWFLWNTNQKYFKEDQIAICLLKLSGNFWLLTTIKKITKDLNIRDGVCYVAEEILKYKKFFGRVIVEFHGKTQSQGYYFDTICDKLEVNKVLDSEFDDDGFPGYDNVHLSFKRLEAVLNKNKSDWVAPLESQKAVYLITDYKNGKHYVGSATSEKGMLLSRWKNYIQNGHGGNKELRELVEKEGFDYVKNNFYYSILENYNGRVDDKTILVRESWWKEVLQTRKFGYNSN